MTAVQQGKMKLRLDGPNGVALILDRSEVFPDDPGNGTPALVYYKGGSGTYFCVCDNCEVDTPDGTMDLPIAAMKWLESQEQLVDEFCYGND